MQVAILGPLEVRDGDGERLDVTGARLRALLIRLVLDAGRPVPVSALADAVWADAPPAEAANALQTLVSRLRRALGGSVLIAQGPGGYRIEVAEADVDARRFEQLAAEGGTLLRNGDPQQAVPVLTQAIALWRGPALVDAGEFAEADAARLHDRRLAARIDLLEAQLLLGQAGSVTGELEALCGEHPLHERLAGLLMRALAATGRQADALGSYERVRARLAEQLGVDPSPELQATHVALLRGEFGLAAAPAPQPPPTNLRAQLTSFVGREDEVARIGKSLELNRLVTLVGPGGGGKTRLASEAAARIVDTAADGVWFAELAAVTDPGDIAQTVLSSLGIRETHLLERRAQLRSRDAVTRLTDVLSDRRALVVLDNCEHLIDGCAHLVDQLLARCPGLRILATSREPLGITGETLQVVTPLRSPAADTGAADALEFPSVRLFADRAAAARPGFVVDDDTAGTVIEIVQRLDGLPLAIELAAARLRSLPLTEIAERLCDRFRLLTGGSRAAMPRHRTLRAVVDWSWGLLTPAERLLAERLAVFPAGVTSTSAREVCADDGVPEADVGDLLSSLVDKSLLVRIADGTRLRMLETIREYGTERLAEQGELTAARSRHAEYFADLLREAEPHLTAADQLPWFALLAAERENILAAQRHLCDSGEADRALEIGITLAGYAMLLGNHADVPGLLDEPLRAPGVRDPQMRNLAEVLHMMNSAMAGEAGSSADDPEEVTNRLGDVADTLDGVDLGSNPLLGLLRVAVAYFAGDPERADRFVEEALSGPYEWTAAGVLMFRASVAENNGDIVSMRADIAEALARFRRLGERWGIASTLRGVALLHTYDGDLGAAEAAYTEALELITQLGSSDDESFLRARVADLRLRRGDIDGARAQIARALEASQASGSPLEPVFITCLAAALEREAGNLDQARRLQRLATERAAAIGSVNTVRSHALAIVQIMTVSFAVADGALDEARAQMPKALHIARETKDKPIMSAAGVALADLLLHEGSCADAARILGAAAVLRGAEDPTALDVARLTGALTDALGADGFASGYAEGRGLDQDAALALFDAATTGPS